MAIDTYTVVRRLLLRSFDIARDPLLLYVLSYCDSLLVVNVPFLYFAIYIAFKISFILYMSVMPNSLQSSFLYSLSTSSIRVLICFPSFLNWILMAHPDSLNFTSPILVLCLDLMFQNHCLILFPLLLDVILLSINDLYPFCCAEKLVALRNPGEHSFTQPSWVERGETDSSAFRAKKRDSHLRLLPTPTTLS